MPKYESWQMGAAVRKAIRQAPVVSDAPATRSVPNSRKTKKWCRGKAGVEHVLNVKTHRELKNWVAGSDILKGWLVCYCSKCGKEIESYIPPINSRTAKPVPDWAAEYFRANPEEATSR